jgi:(1->4)-alpha-D-glucan 1-alpha-D-glucosylmutase
MRIPSSTYRVQFSLNFRFADAEALVPYLHDLGISDLYASPRFKARKGSSHGYDVADPLRINSELGTEEEFDRLVARLHQYGMGLLLDIVPNHMAASSENPWWMDVLENGRKSPYAAFFDIDWKPHGIKLARLDRDRVTLPILAAPYIEVLWSQGIRLRFDDRGFFLHYEDHRLPLNPGTYCDILDTCLESLENQGTSARASVERLRILSEGLSKPEDRGGIPSDDLGEAIAELKSELWRLYQSDETVRRALEAALRVFHGVQGEASSFDPLNSLIGKQAYRLAHWRLAPFEINYRRFFDINDLVGLRIEDPLVFSARHSSIMRLIQEGKVSGLRVDHIDGLRDPLEYLNRLKSVPISGGDDNDHDGSHIYTIVEKITSGDETFPPDWPVMGTTGYDFLNALNALFIDPEGYRELEQHYRRFTGIEASFADTWYQRSKQLIDELFAADMNLLSYRLGCIAALVASGADVPVRELIAGLTEITACLPVYRTYYRNATVSEHDRIVLESAFSEARRRACPSSVSGTTFDFLRSIFLAEMVLESEEMSEAWLNFIARWQQLTSAVMAKGLEDTALFAHHGLISVNEVGNNPFHESIHFGAEAFHDFNCSTLRDHPHTMNTTSTHDTKWSEDARARINVLSEVPHEWAKRLRRWSRINKRHKQTVDGRFVPTPNEETILYQAMLGIWPPEPFESIDKSALQSRLEEFAIKAAREAKTNTNWLSPNEKHESALRHFVSFIVSAPQSDAFMSDFLKVHQGVAFLGACNSFAQLILKITAPGVPDFYQGSELWNLNLTDPDNRRPVDFRSRIDALEALKSRGPELRDNHFADLLSNWHNGSLKLYLTGHLLNFRRSNPELLSKGCYQPISAGGEHKGSIFAFARHLDDQWLIVAVPRLLKNVVKGRSFPLGEVWETTSLEIPSAMPEDWTDILTNRRVSVLRAQASPEEISALPIRQLFRHFPFAVLASAERQNHKA